MTSNRRRGSEGERLVVNKYRKIRVDAKRNRQDTANHNLPDVSTPFLSIEVKKGTGKGTYQSKMLDRCMEQARLNCQEGTWTALHHTDGARTNRYVTMFESEFLELIENWRANQ